MTARTSCRSRRPCPPESNNRLGAAANPMSPRLPIPRHEVAGLCRKHGVRRFSLFGSVLRDDFGPDTDVDVLVAFRPEVRYSLFDLVDTQDELSKMVDRKAAVVEFKALRPWMQEESPGPWSCSMSRRSEWGLIPGGTRSPAKCLRVAARGILTVARAV